MIEFTGSNYTFEIFSYVFDNPLRTINMGRVHFTSSPIGIEYLEGTLYETEKEFVESHMGLELEPIIVGMTLMGVHKIKFKNGEEYVSESLKDARQGLAVPITDNIMLGGYND